MISHEIRTPLVRSEILPYLGILANTLFNMIERHSRHVAGGQRYILK